MPPSFNDLAQPGIDTLNGIGGVDHHSKLVKAWVAERKDRIELFYLPSYSPQLNPEERLKAHLKQDMGKRVPMRTKAKLHEAANEHMTM